MLKKIPPAILVLIVFCLIGGFFYVQHLKPNYSGNLTLEGLSGEVEVYFDEFGIPHIYAESEEDGYLALGYVHAQDRLFQMEVFRRIIPGRLSEVFGRDMVKTDRFFKTLGVNAYSEKLVETFEASGDPKIRKAANAYLSGINQFVANGPTPIEYTILGIDKTPFTLVDINNALGYVSFSFAAAQRIEPRLTKIYKELGAAYLEPMDLGNGINSLTIPNYENIEPEIELSNYVSEVLKTLPTAVWYGSNSWVLGPEKTKSGKVILENDPHIAFSQPAVWYEAHMETPEYSFYGYHMAGIPFAVLGHSREFATGLTMFTNDDMDLFQEKTSASNPDKYIYRGEELDFDNRTETIVVKDSSNVEIDIRTTVHGPVVNDVLDLGADPISLYWTFTQVESPNVDMLYNLSHASSMSDARETASKVHAPGLNIMYGDREGNIAWWASAKLLQRNDSTNSALIKDGESGAYDYEGFMDFSENPKSENPPWDYVYSANNQTRTASGVPYPGHYAPEDRARRIISMIEAKDKLDVEDVKRMALDVKSENAPEIVKEILNVIGASDDLSQEAKSAVTKLGGWDGSFHEKSITATIFTKVVYKILEGAMMDEMGEKDFKSLFETHMIQRTTQPLMANDSTVWWDNILTENKTESREDIFLTAINEGVAELVDQLGEDMDDWQWGKVHTLEHNHAFGKVELLRKYFNVGPFAVGGSRKIVNNLKFDVFDGGLYPVKTGPSTRRIVDFADVENNSWSILPTGNSGNLFSDHYDDQAEMYVKGEYRKMMMNEEEIRQSDNLLRLKPVTE
ncbi:MAG: penicillin acylase family protein [Cyclobacteriaceae bacterium]